VLGNWATVLRFATRPPKIRQAFETYALNAYD
jgi:hypothetical protein